VEKCVYSVLLSSK